MFVLNALSFFGEGIKSVWYDLFLSIFSALFWRFF